MAKHFKDLDMLVLVGELAHMYFGQLAEQEGYEPNINLFFFPMPLQPVIL